MYFVVVWYYMSQYLFYTAQSNNLIGHKNVEAQRSAVCFLTARPALETVAFAEELAKDGIQYGLDVFIMIDDNNFKPPIIDTSSHIQFLQISNEKCIRYGYQKTISLRPKWREVTSWDKALLYFGVLKKHYSFVWLVENDVFIPSVRAFRSLHQLYANTSDLITQRNEINLLGNTSTWLWSMAIEKLTPPWSCSMVNVIGLSRRILTAMDDYVQWRGEVPFHEFFFNTLAMQLNMNIVSPSELSTIIFSRTYSIEQVSKQPNNLWHPVKDLAKQKRWRAVLVFCN
jgi:hypothetical protein